MARGPCPKCGVDNRVFFGDVFGVKVSGCYYRCIVNLMNGMFYIYRVIKKNLRLSARTVNPI